MCSSPAENVFKGIHLRLTLVEISNEDSLSFHVSLQEQVSDPLLSSFLSFLSI
jgi:hypothetical protein